MASQNVPSPKACSHERGISRGAIAPLNCALIVKSVSVQRIRVNEHPDYTRKRLACRQLSNPRRHQRRVMDGTLADGLDRSDLALGDLYAGNEFSLFGV